MLLRVIVTISCVVGVSEVFGFVAKRQAGKTCSADGKTFNDGETFSLSVTGPCVTFLCKDGGVFPDSYGCERDLTCHPLGDTYNIGCIERKCQAVNGYFDYVRTNEGCTYKDVCLKIDETYDDGCFKYKCLKTDLNGVAYYSVDLVEWGCNRAGMCYPANYTLTEQCQTMVCENINGVVGFRSKNIGCQFGTNNVCLQIGETIEDACRTYECKKTMINNVPLMSVEPISAKCQDSNLDCKEPGTYFSFVMGGQVRQNCTCHVESSLGLQYIC